MKSLAGKSITNKNHLLLWNWLRPAAYELIFFAGCGLIFIGAAFIVNLVTDTALRVDNASPLTLLHDQYVQFLQVLQQQTISADFVTFTFWLFLGGLVYSLSWALLTAIIDTYNDIVISSVYIHPDSFHQSDYWLAVFSRKLIKTFAWLSLLYVGYILLVWVFPVWFDAARVSLQALFTVSSAVNLLISFAGVAVSVYALRLLYRLARG